MSCVCLSAYVYVYMCTYGGQKAALDPLEQELQAAVSLHVGDGT